MCDTDKYYDFLQNEHYLYVDFCHSIKHDNDFFLWAFPTTTKTSQRMPIIDIIELRNNRRFNSAQNLMKVSLKKIKERWGIFDDKLVVRFDFKRLNDDFILLSRILQSLVYHDLEYEASNLLDIVLNNKILLDQDNSTFVWKDDMLKSKNEKNLKVV